MSYSFLSLSFPTSCRPVILRLYMFQPPRCQTINQKVTPCLVHNDVAIHQSRSEEYSPALQDKYLIGFEFRDRNPLQES